MNTLIIFLQKSRNTWMIRTMISVRNFYPGQMSSLQNTENNAEIKPLRRAANYSGVSTVERLRILYPVQVFQQYQVTQLWVNNLDRLVELFSQISANDIADIEETEVIESERGIPAYQYYKQHKEIQSTAIFPVPYGVKMLPIVMFESRLKCLFRLKIFLNFLF